MTSAAIRPAPEGAPSAFAQSGVLRLAAPLVVSFWMRSLFALVDTVYAATLGDAEVAAVGLTVPLEFLMIACWVGVSNGLTSTLARAMGARDEAAIDRLLASSRRIVGALVPCFMLIGASVWLFASRLGLDPEVARLFAIYGSVLVAGSAISSFWSIIPDSIVKAHHDTRSTMWAGIWSNMINVTLNTIFVFVFHWGVLGIALSTVLGRFGGLVYALRRAAALEAARRSAASPPSTAGSSTVAPRPYGAILMLAVPAAATYALMAMESSLVNSILATLDHATEAIAAYSIYFRVMLLCVMPIIATSVAMLPFVARRFGENDLPGIRRGLRDAMFAAAAYCVFIVAPVMLLAGKWIAGALAESEVTSRFTAVALWACPVACLAATPFFLARPVFEGMQRARPGLIAAILRYVILTIPCAFGGARLAPLAGISSFMGMLAGLIVASSFGSALLLGWARSALIDAERRGSVIASEPAKEPALPA